MKTRSDMRLVPLLLVLPLAGQEWSPGHITDKVNCAAAPGETYALYIPSGYHAGRSWPVLYCFDPGARGRVPVERFREGAERFGYIVAGSNNSRNGPPAPGLASMRAMWEDTRVRFRIDDRRVYLAGFSGGARLANSLAPGSGAAGVISCGAGFSGDRPKTLAYRFLGVAGVDDFNYPELRAVDRLMEGSGATHAFLEFDGGHEWPPGETCARALEWLGSPNPQKPASKEELKREQTEERRQRDAEREIHGLLAALEEAEKRAETMAQLRASISRFSRGSRSQEDSSERRVARRILGGTYIYIMEQSRGRRPAEAIPALEVAALIYPERPGAFVALATAYAESGNRKRALQNLRKASEAGFRDAARIESDPAFDALRRDGEFREWLQGLGGATGTRQR
jgi:hypothetical protein